MENQHERSHILLSIELSVSVDKLELFYDFKGFLSLKWRLISANLVHHVFSQLASATCTHRVAWAKHVLLTKFFADRSGVKSPAKFLWWNDIKVIRPNRGSDAE